MCKELKETELDEFVQNIIQEYSKIRVFALAGDLGAGKTRFSRSFCEFFQVKEKIKSPTFSIVNSYSIPNSEQKIHHFDLYRIENEEELEEMGFEEYFAFGDYCLVEWPKIGIEYFPANTLFLNFEHIDENTRKICVKIK